MKQMIQKKIKILIYCLLILLIFIFGFSWLRYGARPQAIVKYLLAQMGSTVGVSLNVPENPFNTWAKQLQEKETELQAREQKIDELLSKTARESRVILTLILVLTIILVLLILLNFYFDYQTRKFQKV